MKKNKESSEVDDTLQVEHEQFLEDLLKALKCEDDDEKDPFKVDEEEKEEKFPIHDAATHWKLKRPLVSFQLFDIFSCIFCTSLLIIFHGMFL